MDKTRPCQCSSDKAFTPADCRAAGAKYVVLTAKHGDEFAIRPSKYTERHAVKMGL